MDNEPEPPINVHVHHDDDTQTPIEFAYSGFDGSLHTWKATHVITVDEERADHICADHVPPGTRLVMQQDDGNVRVVEVPLAANRGLRVRRAAADRQNGMTLGEIASWLSDAARRGFGPDDHVKAEVSWRGQLKAISVEGDE